MAKHMRGDSAADMGTVGNLFDHALDRPDTNLHPVIQAQMPLQKRLDAGRERNDATL